MRARAHLRPDVFKPALQEFGNGGARRFDVGAPCQFGDQASAFDLCLPFSAFECVPPTFAFERFWVSHVENNCPMPGRSFANVAFHYFAPNLANLSVLSTTAVAVCSATALMS